MSEYIIFTVPENVGEVLQQEGYDEAYVGRNEIVSPEMLQATFEFLGAGLSLAANGITILVGYHQLKDAITSMARSLRNEAPDENATIEANIEKNGVKTQFRVSMQGKTDKSEQEFINEALSQLQKYIAE